MSKYSTNSFDRIANSQLGSGRSTEYRNELGETLAYVDYSEDGATAWVTVFNPYRQGERRYSRRPSARAEAIAEKHANNY